MKITKLTNVTAIACFVVLFNQQLMAQEMSELLPANDIIQITKVSKQDNTYTRNMKLAYNIGKEINQSETMQAILLQETRAGTGGLIGGRGLPLNKQSLGVMQVQIGAARSVFVHHPRIFDMYFPDRSARSVKDNEVANLLMTDTEANIRIATYHLQTYLTIVKGSWRRAVAGYNVGIGRVMNPTSTAGARYVSEIQHKIKTIVVPFNRNSEMTV